MNPDQQQKLAEEIFDFFQARGDVHKNDRNYLVSILNDIVAKHDQPQEVAGKKLAIIYEMEKEYPMNPQDNKSLDEIVEKHSVIWHTGKYNTLSELLRNVAIEHVAQQTEERLKKLHAKFGYVPHPDGSGKCNCAYCARDVDALADMCAEYEMENFSLINLRDQLKREVEELKCYVSKAIITKDGTLVCSPQVGTAYNELRDQRDLANARLKTLARLVASLRDTTSSIKFKAVEVATDILSGNYASIDAEIEKGEK